MGRGTQLSLFALIFMALTWIYLYPGSEALLMGRTDLVMSDGTDVASLPYIHEQMAQVWKTHPGRMFYGAVYSDIADPEHGIATWIPWNERWIVVAQAIFFPPEQLSTAFSATLLILNSIAMYLLATYLGWPAWVSAALGFCWGFNPFTRARAKVHPALAGTYHIPLIFLGLFLVARGRSKRSLAWAALAFLLAGTVAHYYLITTLFLSPFFLLFLWMQPEFKKEKWKLFQRLAIAVSPLLIFLAANFHFSVPSDARVGGVDSMNIKKFEEGKNDPFLDVFYSHPEDFLAGDIALEYPPFDWNPLRSWINSDILANFGKSNPHERTNGIRWSIWLMGLAGVGLLFRKGKKAPPISTRQNIIFFTAFGLFTFWQATGPNFPTHEFNPSYWLYSLCSKIRVTTRAGILVHFSLLMLAGFFLTTEFKWRKYLLMPGVLLALMFIDYPPFQKMPMAPIQPAYTELQREKGACGVGMAFPFFNSYIAMGAQYVFAQRMRGSDCYTLNQLVDVRKIEVLTRAFPPAEEFISTLASSPDAANRLITLVKCVPLNWIVFHEITPKDWAVGVCRDLGWSLSSDGVCAAPNKNQPQLRSLDECIR